MREALRPILTCALTVALSAAVHGQLVDTKFEKYTRFLTALILLSLLITPMLSLFSAGGELITPADGEGAQTESTLDALSYTDALLSTIRGKVEDDARSLLRGAYGIDADVQVTMDGSDPQAIRVASVRVTIRGDADPAEIARTLEERYDCERVSVMANA